MNIQQIEITCRAAFDEVTRDEIDAHLDALADAFHDVEGIEDQAMTVDIGTGRVVFAFVVTDADNELDAVVFGYAAVRTAIHTADGSTPGWEDMLRDLTHRLGTPDADCVPA